MTRKQQQGLLLVVLVGVMVAVYARLLRPSGGRPMLVLATPVVTVARPTSPPVAALPAPKPVVDQSQQREAQRRHAGQLSWSRDPFTRGAATGAASGLVLTGVLWDPKTPAAIISGQVVRVGEELEGYRVIAIGQDRVSMTDGTQTFQLLISP